MVPGVTPGLDAQPPEDASGFVLSDQESDVYYDFAAVAGEQIGVEKDDLITGDLHSNGDVDLEKDSAVDGDVTAAGEVTADGEVSGTVTAGAAPVTLPLLLDEESLRALADRVFEEDTTFTDEVVNDVVFVAGTARVRGDVSGVGTLIATRDVRLDTTEGDTFSLAAGTRLSLIALDDVRIGKDRLFRGVARAGRDVDVETGAEIEGVLVADRNIHVKMGSRITFVDFDQVAPEIVLVAPADGSFVATATPEISVTYSDDFSGLRLESLELLLDGVDRVDEATVTETGLTFTPSEPLSEGLHTLEVAITDHSDNEARETFTFTVDVTAPALAIMAPNAQFINDTTPQIVVSYSDGVSEVDLATLVITVDGIVLTPGCAVGPDVATCESPELAEGAHAIAASVSDLAGNPASVTRVVTVDVTPPEITATADPPANAAGWNNADVTVSFDCQDALSGVVSCPGPVVVMGGCVEEEVSGSVSDQAGNTSSVSLTVRVDRLPPVVSGALDPAANANGWHNAPVTASFEATDDCSGVVGVTPPVLLASEGAGQEVTGTATDLADNSASATVVANIDLTPPTIAATAAPPANAGGWNNTDVTVSFDCQDALSGVESCPGPVTLSDEGAGQVVDGTASDLAGNSAFASATVSIDRTPPTFDPAELRPLPCPELTLELQPRVRACFADALSGVVTDTVQLSVDGVDRTAAAVIEGNCIAWDPPDVLDPGEHQATIAATDQADNADSASWCFDVASPALAIAIDSPAVGFVTRGDAVDVAGTVDELADTVEVNGVAAVVGGGSFQATGVPVREGKTVLTAVARNAVGGIGTASVAVFRDTTPPVVRIETPRDGAVLTALQVDVGGLVNDLITGTTINADDCQVSVNGVEAAVANRSFVVSDLLLKRGLNTITAEARDRTGNVAVNSIQVTVEDQAGQRIRLLAGNSQAAGIFEELPDPLIVVLEDANGDPVPGRPVTFAVTRGDGTVRAFPQEGSSVSVLTDDFGQASVSYRLSGRAGAGNNRVLATAPGFLGEVEFCATGVTGPARRVTTLDGSNQRGVVEQPLPLPLVVLVTDHGGNPVAGVEVTFEVVEGGGSFDAAPSAVNTTDFDGLAEIVWTLGADEGINNNVARASFAGLAEAPASFIASAQRVGRPSDTRLSGVVVDNQDNPIAGVTVEIEDTSLTAVTDDQGQFSIAGVPVGSIHMLVDGSTTSRPGRWPSLSFQLTTISGRDNSIDRPVYLLPLDTASGAMAGGSEDMTLRMANVPGAELTVFANSVTCPDGSSTCEITVTQVRGERVPMEPPMGSSFMLAWTIQPAGTRFNPPARLCIPNSDMPPGQQVEMFSFDHDQGEFVAVGTATVTGDGSQICSDPGFGVVKAGWFGCVPPPPPQKCLKKSKTTTTDKKICDADGAPTGTLMIDKKDVLVDDMVTIMADVKDPDKITTETTTTTTNPCTGSSSSSTSSSTSDMENTSFDYTWTTTGPAGVSIPDQTGATYTSPKLTEPGEYEVTLKVKDSGSSSSCDTGTLVDSGEHTIGSEKFRVLEIKLMEVSFADDHDITKDDRSPISDPVWVDSNTDGTPETDEPVAYTRNTNPKLTAEFKVDPAPSASISGVTVRGKGSGGLTFEKSGVTLSGTTLTISDVVSSAKLVNEIDLLDPLSIDWEVSLDGSSFTSVGSSAHKVFVTLATPTASPLFETLLDIGTRNADGETGDAGAVAKIWNDFTDRSVARADGVVMRYWLNEGDPLLPTVARVCQLMEAMIDPSPSTPALNGIGTCVAWSNLFHRTLRAQGISGSTIVEVRADRAVNAGADGFLVKKWNFGLHIRTGPNGLRNSDTAGDDFSLFPKGSGFPDQPCVGPGTNGTLDTTPAGDDAVSGGQITTGADGVCNTTKSGDDVQLTPVGQGGPDLPAITPGPDGTLNSTAAPDDTPQDGLFAGALYPYLIHDPTSAPFGDAADQIGVSGQGGISNPPGAFFNHFVVRYSGKIYDPSYGVGPFASEVAHENAAIDGISSGSRAKKNESAKELSYTP